MKKKPKTIILKKGDNNYFVNNPQQKQIYKMPDALQKETRFPLQTDILKKSLTSPDDIWSLTNASPRQFEQKYYYHPEDGNNSLYGFETIQALDDIRNSKALEYISYGLAGASLIPFIDTAADLISIPVDLLRGDYVSAGLDAAGAIPLFGEAADAAKLARIGFDAADTAKDVDNITDAVRITESADDIHDLTKASDNAYKAYEASEFAKYPKSLHEGRQGKHIVGHNNYITGKSVISIPCNELQKLVLKNSGTGELYGTKEVVDFGTVIGFFVDRSTGKMYKTTIGTIHYSKDGVHVVPAIPKEWRY